MARTEIPIVVLHPDTGDYVSGATVSVTKRSDESAATVFQNETGVAVVTPVTTDVQGRIQGWLDRGAYRLSITIPGRPPYDEYVDSVPGGDGDIATAFLADGAVTTAKIADVNVTTGKLVDGAVTSAKIADGTIATGDLADGAVTSAKIAEGGIATGDIADEAITAPKLADNILPLGTVIDWYRPNTTIAVPDGWEVADGRAWSAVPNDWGVATGNMPNLIGKTTMGARLTVNSDGSGGNADGLASSNGDAHTNAPGIGGVGGSNTAKNLSTHTHTISSDGSHSHTVNNHDHFFRHAIGVVAGVLAVLNPTGNSWMSSESGGGISSESHAFVSGASYATANIEKYGSYTDGSAPGTSSAGSHSHGGATGNASSMSAVDVRGAHVGMLKLMKVRNV